MYPIYVQDIYVHWIFMYMENYVLDIYVLGNLCTNQINETQDIYVKVNYVHNFLCTGKICTLLFNIYSLNSDIG